MSTFDEKQIVSCMSRHFVALACEYESLNRDGSVAHTGTTVLSGFLMEILEQSFWVTAGHCLRDDLDAQITAGNLRVTGGGFMDYFGPSAEHQHLVPHTYHNHSALYIHEPDHGLDFALLPLNTLQVKAFLANQALPIRRDNWTHQPELTFDFYRMLGVPADNVFHGRSVHDVRVQQVLVAVNKVPPETPIQPPPGVKDPSQLWFTGCLPQGTEALKNIKGMSGGPIFGFRKDSMGNATYHVVAIQSRWWNQSRTIFGCSVPYFAELVIAMLNAPRPESESTK